MLEAYIGKARGGRVVQTLFLEAEVLEELRRRAQAEGLGFQAFGGLPLALRRVAVLYPPQVPEVSDPTVVLYLSLIHI